MITKKCDKCNGNGKYVLNNKHIPCLNCEGIGIISTHKMSLEERKEEKLNKERNKTIDLWSEGYAATGESSDAIFHGTFKSKDLRDAVIQFRDSLDDEGSKNCIDIKRLTFWGCKFYDNESEARKSFG